MSKTIQFGEEVPGYSIRVLNEREIRAAAGILFLATFFSLMLIIFKGNFLPVKYVITIFFFESAFGICLACKFYSLIFRQKAQYCPGEVCQRQQRQDIQRTTGAQLF